MTENNTLVLNVTGMSQKEVERDLVGEYRCLTSNGVSSANASAQLMIAGSENKNGESCVFISELTDDDQHCLI